MSWRGWGDPRHIPDLTPRVVKALEAEIGTLAATTTPVTVDEVRLRPSTVSSALQTDLERTVGAAHLTTDRLARIRRSGGKSYTDLWRRRDGDAEGAPDAVVFPADHDEVTQVLEVATRHGAAIVPYGGGTSVVGGLEPCREDRQTLVSLDLSRMDRVVAVDETSRLATFEPGVRGPAAEAELRRRGFTLGHFPQSYAYASIGGYVATRSAGQASTGYGRVDQLVHQVRLATPTGTVVAGGAPASAAGPDLRQLLIGSEGTLGVITQATLQIQPAPEEERYEARAVGSFHRGLEVLRHLQQEGMAPDVCRLSDPDETRLFAQQADGGAGRLFRGYLRTRGYGDGCLLLLGWSGLRRQIALSRAAAARVLSEHTTIRLGSRPGQSWAQGRFDGPYLRDALMDRGVMVETLETATTYTNVERLYSAVRGAIRHAMADSGRPGVVLCHVSHLYDSGCSLYFTWLCRERADDVLGQYRTIKEAASTAITRAGGTITHHHGVGTEHRAHLTAEIGERGAALLRAVKQELDPAGIMNPGKLIPLPGDHAQNGVDAGHGASTPGVEGP